MDIIRKFFAATLLVAVLSVSAIVNAASVSGQGTWETTLLGRDLDGNAATFEAYYDTALNITWLADANYAFTSGYIDTIDTIYDNGRMNWDQAMIWVDQLGYGGYSDWRLPNAGLLNPPISSCSAYDGSCDSGYNIMRPEAELGHMFYVSLGNSVQIDVFNIPDTEETITSASCPDGTCLTNTGSFINLFEHAYYTSDELSGYPDNKYEFLMTIGSQGTVHRSGVFYAWAVHDGDIGAVPIPAAAWLFGSGLIGLIGVARCKKA